MGKLIFWATVTALLLTSFMIIDINSPPPKPTVASEKITQETADLIRVISRDIYHGCMGQQADCYEETTEERLLAVYPAKQILGALYDYDAYFSCHAFTHFLGRGLYKKLRSIPDAYSQIDFTCHGGAYHGVMEAFLEENKITVDRLDGDKLREICAKSHLLTDKNQDQVYTECLHGFGHAFMFITDSNLPLSLGDCDRLKTIQEREPCYGGVFMENSTSSTNPDHPPKWVKEDDKFYPCTILSPKYLNQCYFYQSNYLIKITVHDYDQVFGDCEELEGSHYTNCILGLGANLAGFSRKAGITGAAQICQMGKGDADKICIEGAVPSFMARYGGEAEKIIEFCQNVADNLKELCFVKLGYLTASWHQDEQKVKLICQKARQFIDACLGNSTQKPKY